MGLLSGLIGGFAQGGMELADSTLKANQRKADQEYENELLMKRQIAFEKLREQFEQSKAQAKRTQDMTDAKTVQGEAEDKRIERAQRIINADTGIQHTPDEVKRIIADPTWVENYGAKHQTETGAPTEWTGGGLINQRTGLVPSTDRTREQELNDKADSAMDIGRLDMERGFRDLQNQERLYQRASDQDAATNKRLDNTEAYNTKHLDETIRHNKEVEKAAAARTGAEKLSPAAKAALELASNGLATAQIELKQALNEQTKVQTKEYSDLEQKKLDMAAADSKYAMAKKDNANAIKHYNNTMATYLVGYKPVGGLESQKQPVTITLPSGGKLVIGEASTDEEAIAIKKKFDSDNAERNKGKTTPQADIVGSQKGGVAIPMEFVRRANGDPVMARKLFEEDELNKLSSALPKNQSLVNTRHYMAPR